MVGCWFTALCELSASNLKEQHLFTIDRYYSELHLAARCCSPLKQPSRCHRFDLPTRRRHRARDWDALQSDSIKMGADSLARQLRSRVRDEFFGPTSSARERVKDMSAATARHTTRGPMVLGKPLSSITGSILTSVPLPARTPPPAAGREPPPDRGGAAASKSMRFGEIEGGSGGSDCCDGDGERNSAGMFW